MLPDQRLGQQGMTLFTQCLKQEREKIQLSMTRLPPLFHTLVIIHFGALEHITLHRLELILRPNSIAISEDIGMKCSGIAWFPGFQACGKRSSAFTPKQ